MGSWPQTEGTIYGILRNAVLGKKPVRLRYEGHDRYVCPHRLGTTKRHKNCLAYQFGGYSEGGLEPDGSRKNWRCFHVDEITRAEIITGDWHTATWPSSRKGKQTCVEHIDVRA